METAVHRALRGHVTELQALAVGETVAAGQVVAVIRPGAVSGAGGAGRRDAGRRARAGARCSPRSRPCRRWRTRAWRPVRSDPGVVRQRSRGKLTCRERIDLLLDDGTLPRGGQPGRLRRRTTMTATSPRSRRPTTSAAGAGSTARTASSAPTTSRRAAAMPTARSAQKSRYLDRLSIELRMPVGPPARRLVGRRQRRRHGAASRRTPAKARAKESTGAIKAGRPRVTGGGGSFLPGHLGSSMYTEQLATVPVVNMLLGSVVGIGAAKAVLGHFSVMVRDIAQLFVAGPPVVSHAMGYDITKEDLGGWHIHCRNGSVDNLAESEEEAMAMTRRFLSYLPPSVYEAPPVLPPNPDDPAGSPRRGAAHADPAQAHHHLRRARSHPADGRQGLVLRDRPAVGHRPGHRLRALQRPPDGRDRLRQPPRQRRRADRRRLRQAQAPPGPVRSVPPAGAEPDRQPGLRRRPRARDRRHDPQGRRVDDRVRAGARCRSSRC